jgi:Ion transport protein
MIATSIRTHKAFEATSIGIILLNCVQLAADNNTSGESSSFMETIDRLFLAAYTLEMIIKILSLGLVFNEGAYLRDAFNILDCTIVLSAYLQIIQEAAAAASEGPKQKGVSLNALRAFRVLRPLRSITAIKGLRILVQSLLAALPLLKDTIIVLVFFLLIFAIAGNQLISGNLKSRCINIYTGQMFIGEE